MGQRVKPTEQALRAVWRDVEELSDREQLALYKLLGDRLALGPGRPSEVDPQIAERAEALEDLARAAEHLQLPPDTAPTTEQYTEAREALGLSHSWQQIQRRWESWLNAKEALVGRRSVRTARQRSHARATGGRGRESEEYIAGVGRWLDDHPANLAREDYDDWVDEYNERLPSGQAPLVKASAIIMALAIAWEAVVAIGYGETDVEAAQAEALARRARASGSRGLVGLIDVAQLLDVSRRAAAHHVSRAGFPVRVARLSNRPAWVKTDVEAWKRGEAVPERELDEAQPELIDSREMGGLVGLKPDVLRTRIHERRWDRVPEPSGQVSDVHYWERSDYEAWQAGRA